MRLLALAGECAREPESPLGARVCAMMCLATFLSYIAFDSAAGAPRHPSEEISRSELTQTTVVRARDHAPNSGAEFLHVPNSDCRCLHIASACLARTLHGVNDCSLVSCSRQRHQHSGL